MLSEIYRVLSPTGVYICITYGLPEQRMDYFRKPEFYWNPIQHKIAKPTISTSAVVASEDKNEKNFHYIYVMRKQVDKQKEWISIYCSNQSVALQHKFSNTPLS